MEAFEKCVCDHSLANPDAMRATLNLIRPQDMRLMGDKATKEKCKHIFISTDFELTQKLSQDIRCCVHNCSLVLVCMYVCLFVCLFVLQFVSIVMYPGNKLRGNRDCAIIIRRGGVFKTGRGQCLNYSEKPVSVFG